MEIKLTGEDVEFLNAYQELPERDKRLVAYIIRIGASNIFSSEEYGEFLELLRD